MTFFDQIAGGATLGAAMLVGLSVAQAGYVVDLTQQGSDVVASGSGEIDLTGLIDQGSAEDRGALVPKTATIITGPYSPDEYYTGLTGPTNFGSGYGGVASSNAGDIVGIGFGYLGTVYYDLLSVPKGYVSGNSLSDTATYGGQTFSSLGVTPGTYEWTWGSGANQNFTLVIGATVPESSTWAMMLIGVAGLAFAGYRRTRRGAAGCQARHAVDLGLTPSASDNNCGERSPIVPPHRRVASADASGNVHAGGERPARFVEMCGHARPP